MEVKEAGALTVIVFASAVVEDKVAVISPLALVVVPKDESVLFVPLTFKVIPKELTF